MKTFNCGNMKDFATLGNDLPYFYLYALYGCFKKTNGHTCTKLDNHRFVSSRHVEFNFANFTLAGGGHTPNIERV